MVERDGRATGRVYWRSLKSVDGTELCTVGRQGGDQEEESDEMEWYRRMTLRKEG